MLPDGGGEFQHVQILQNVWDWHQAENSEKSEANPRPIQEYADKHWRNGEVINEGSDLEHEVEFVIGSDKLYQNVSDCLLLCLPFTLMRK